RGGLAVSSLTTVRPPSSPPFPYTTLFRSWRWRGPPAPGRAADRRPAGCRHWPACARSRCDGIHRTPRRPRAGRAPGWRLLRQRLAFRPALRPAPRPTARQGRGAWKTSLSQVGIEGAEPAADLAVVVDLAAHAGVEPTCPVVVGKATEEGQQPDHLVRWHLRL